MSLKEELLKEIEKGRQGKAGVIPVMYNRVGDYIDIAKNTYYTVGGESGAGKSTLVQDLFIVNTIDWYLANKNDDIKLSIIYFGMERKLYTYTSRWLVRKIFQEQGEHIAPKRVLGRKAWNMMNEDEYALVKEYADMLDVWEKDDLLIAYENSKNPSGISMFLEAFAERHGVITRKNREDKSEKNILTTDKYEPYHPNHIVLVITDHIGILMPEGTDSGEKKQRIDKFSETMRKARDVYGFSPVVVQQLNRGLSDIHRLKMGDLVPKLSDFADSSQTQQDSDVIMALFDPYRHAVSGDPGKPGGYDIKRLVDKNGGTYYRSLHILKNSFGSNNIGFHMAMQPELGIFRTLPAKEQMTDEVYEEVISSNYFLTPQKSIEEQPRKSLNLNKTT